MDKKKLTTLMIIIASIGLLASILSFAYYVATIRETKAVETKNLSNMY